MAEITAALVKELREKTDAPMMDCKKALTEASGDLAKAEEILRIKLGHKASRAAARVAAEGIVGIDVSADGKLGSMIEVNCETDFVAKNEEFLAFVRNLAQLVSARNPADVATLSAMPLGNSTVDAVRTALIGKIGENLSVRRFARVQAKGRISSYVHGGSKIGVLVDLVGGDDQLGKDLAMHVAAAKPKAIDGSGVPAEQIESERRIATEKAAEDAAKSGKTIPPDILARRVDGAVQKHLKDVTLLGQLFIKDDKQSIDQLLKAKKASVANFVLYVVGEGIEKKQTDFAAEVAAQAAAARG